MIKRLIVIKMAVVMLLLCVNLHAAISPVSSVIHYQAQLNDVDGLNVDNNMEVQIWIYSSATDGVSGDLNDKHLLYAERHEHVNIDRGKLRLSIGEGDGLGRFAGRPFSIAEIANVPDLYLKLIIDGEEITPRQKLGYLNSGYKAEYAKVAENVDGELTIDPDDMPLVDANKITGKVPLSRIPTDMSVSKIASPISNSQIPTLTLDKITSGTLNPVLIGGIEKSSIIGGKFPASAVNNTMTDSDVFITSGEAVHLQSISLPTQFTQDECSIFIGIKSIDVGTYNNMAIDALFVWADYNSNHSYRVNCQYEHDQSDQRESALCRAAYLVYCSK